MNYYSLVKMDEFLSNGMRLQGNASLAFTSAMHGLTGYSTENFITFAPAHINGSGFGFGLCTESYQDAYLEYQSGSGDGYGFGDGVGFTDEGGGSGYGDGEGYYACFIQLDSNDGSGDGSGDSHVTESDIGSGRCL